MNQRETRILKTLLNRYDVKIRNKFLNFLQKEDKAAILAEDDISSNEVAPLLFQRQHVLERMHYSWFKSILKNVPEDLIHLYVSALTPTQINGLKSQKLSLMRLSQPIKLFVRGQIAHYLDIENILPVEYLPQSEFSFLLDVEKNQMMDIFDFLGLYDLAAEVRKIINPSHLKAIYTSLTPKQFHFLKICMNQKEKIVSPPLGIENLTHDTQQLKQLIHKRGLVRLGKALCGEHKDLVWYIAHNLDTGRGNILLSQYQSTTTPAITSFLQMQVMNVINFIKKE